MAAGPGAGDQLAAGRPDDDVRRPRAPVGRGDPLERRPGRVATGPPGAVGHGGGDDPVGGGRANWGLPEGVPVVAGGHDQPCGALGAGVVEPGLAMYATGTVECICPAFDRPIFDDEPLPEQPLHLRLHRRRACTRRCCSA